MKPLLVLFCLLFSACSIDIDGPKVTAISPADGESVDRKAAVVRVYFDEPIDTASAASSFSLTEGTGATVNGKVDVFDRMLQFTPYDDLKGGLVYRITISKSLQDIEGNPMDNDYYSQFVTGTNRFPCSVEFVSPTNGEQVLSLTNPIVVRFGRSMDAESVRENVTLSPQVDGRFVWNATTNELTFYPFKDLLPATQYQFSIASDAKDGTGVILGRTEKLFFLTGTNYVQPSVLGVFQSGDMVLPLTGAYWTNEYYGALKEDYFIVDFNSPMDKVATENAFSITPSISGYYSWATVVDGGTNHYQLYFYPTIPLSPGVRYEVKIADSAKGENGLAIKEQFSQNFMVSTNYYIALTNISDLSNVVYTNGAITEISVLSNTLQMVLNFKTYDGTGMNIVAVQDKISIKRFFGVGGGDSAGKIDGFDWSLNNHQLQLDLSTLARSNVYLLKIPGGKDGVTDAGGNWLKDDVEVLFRVK